EAVEHRRPRLRLDKARQRVEDRRLAGPIGADERDDLARANAKRDAANRDDCPIADGKVLDIEDRLVGLAYRPGRDRGLLDLRLLIDTARAGRARQLALASGP